MVCKYCGSKEGLPKKLLKELEIIEKDSVNLKRKKDLTEFGKGELHIIGLVKGYVEKKG
jgi:hypothetical protein